MVDRLRRWFNTPPGRIASVILLLVVGLFGYWNLSSSFGTDDATDAANNRMFIDSKTLQTFKVKLQDLQGIPCDTPEGTKTGYPAEPCFWTADGKVKSTPTWVFVKSYSGSSEPTYCPDCGRLVTELNPPAREGGRPPRKKS